MEETSSILKPSPQSFRSSKRVLQLTSQENVSMGLVVPRPPGGARRLALSKTNERGDHHHARIRSFEGGRYRLYRIERQACFDVFGCGCWINFGRILPLA